MSKVSAKIGKDGEVCEVEYPGLDVTTLADLVAEFGEDKVISHAKSSVTVALQSNIRAMLKAGKSQKEIEEAVSKWKPSTRTPGKSKLEKAQELFGTMSAEERKDLLKRMSAAK